MFKKLFNYYVTQPIAEIKKIKNMVLCALLIALSYVSSWLLTFYPSEYLKISFSFIFVAIAAMKYGPAVGAVLGVLCDIASVLAKPMAPYIPMIGVTNALSGLVVGLFLYKNKNKIWRIIVQRIFVVSFISTLLDTYILSNVLSDKTFLVLLASRSIKNLILLPFEIALLIIILNIVKKIQKDN